MIDPSELIKEHRPILNASISPLVQIAKNNPECLEEIIEFAICLGIRAAALKLQDDDRSSQLDKIKDIIRSETYPRW